MDTVEGVDLTVHQKPEKVSFTCPECYWETEIPYDVFCTEHGDPTDWDYEKVKCEECGKEFIVEDQDWA